MIDETNTQIISGSVYVRLPPHIVRHLNLSKEKADELFIQDEEKSKGKFISVWRKDQKVKKR